MRYYGMLLLSLLLVSASSSTTSCAKAPPSLSPVGVADWNALQLGHNIDLIRDIVDAGTKTTPAVFTRDLNVKVATWHKAAAITLATHSQGWKTTFQTGLDQLLNSLTQAERDKLTPYITLIKTVLAATS